MNKQASNIIVLFTAFVYLVFACLYVVACSKISTHFKFAKVESTISMANSPANKHQGSFLSRPRVVSQKLISKLILPVIALCLSVIIADRLNTPITLFNIPLLVRRRAKIILFQNMRL